MDYLHLDANQTVNLAFDKYGEDSVVLNESRQDYIWFIEQQVLPIRRDNGA
jgi:hypothetical protein